MIEAAVKLGIKKIIMITKENYKVEFIEPFYLYIDWSKNTKSKTIDNLMIQNNIIHSSYLNNVTKLMFLGSSCIYPKCTRICN